MATALNPKGARKARREARRLRGRLRQYKAADARAKRYDPLAPVTGKRYVAERGAAEKLEFGPREAELDTASANQAQTSADRARYYDDWREALRQASARANESNRLNVEQTASRIDKAHTDDSARVAASDAQASDTAAKLGRGPVQSQEGAQAVSAQRAQGEQSLARLRAQGTADEKYMGHRETNSIQAKIEDQDRQAARAEKLRQESKRLAAEKGAFRTDFANKTRKDEREWAAIQKEFGLKSRELDIEAKSSRKDRKLEQQKLRSAQIVARMYASADIAGAKAQVRVAKLHLEKGKIDQKQYRHIVNEYRGLRNGGGAGGGGGGAGAGGQGSGAGGSFAPWERDKISDAVYSLRKHKAAPAERARWMKKMQAAGVPARLARIAWKRYVKKTHPLAGHPN